MKDLLRKIQEESAVTMPAQSQIKRTDARGRIFRFGFILSTSLGNINVYRSLRKFAERDRAIECTWARVKHDFSAGERNPVALVPPPFYTRAVVLNQAWPVLGHMNKFDAVMISALEPVFVAAFRSVFRPQP